MNGKAVQQLRDAGFQPVEAEDMAIFEAASHEKILEGLTDEDYKKISVPDRKGIFNRSKMRMLPLEINRVFDDTR